MANVNINKNVSLEVNDEEKEILQKTHDIIENLRHQWFVSDDNVWDYDEYWQLENTVEMLEEFFDCSKAKK